jgi:hypothetical protein
MLSASFKAGHAVIWRENSHEPKVRPWLFLQVARAVSPRAFFCTGSRETSGNRSAVVAPCVRTLYGDSGFMSNTTTYKTAVNCEEVSDFRALGFKRPPR